MMDNSKMYCILLLYRDVRIDDVRGTYLWADCQDDQEAMTLLRACLSQDTRYIGGKVSAPAERGGRDLLNVGAG